MPTASTEPLKENEVSPEEMSQHLVDMGDAARKLAQLDGAQAAEILRGQYDHPLSDGEYQRHLDLHASARELGFQSTSMSRIRADLEKYFPAAGPSELTQLADRYASRAQAARNAGDMSGIDGYEELEAAAEQARRLADHYGEIVDTVAKSKHEPESVIDVAA
jgi:hypothetical protein